MENIADIGGPLRGGLLEKLSRYVGESPDATQRAFGAALPTTMHAIAEHGSTESGARELLDGFNSRALPELDINDLGQTLSDPQASERLGSSGSGFLEKIMGGNMGGVVDGLSQHSGVNRGAMAKIVALAAPLALGVIGRRARESRYDAKGLAGFLGQQKSLVGKLVPGIVGLGGLAAAKARLSHAAEPSYDSAREPVREASYRDRDVTRPLQREVARPRRSSWLWVIGAVAAALALFMFFGRGRERPALQGRTPVVTAPRATSDVGTLEKSLNGYFAGTDTVARRFTLKDYGPNNHGSADVLASALVAHPESTIRIEASGTDEAAALTEADGLKDYLTGKGVDASRIETAGKVSPGGARNAFEVLVTK